MKSAPFNQDNQPGPSSPLPTPKQAMYSRVKSSSMMSVFGTGSTHIQPIQKLLSKVPLWNILVSKD